MQIGIGLSITQQSNSGGGVPASALLDEDLDALLDESDVILEEDV